jgi:thioredoxin
VLGCNADRGQSNFTVEARQCPLPDGKIGARARDNAGEIPMQTEVITLDEDSFDQILASTAAPLVVDFWAPWCAPCRAMAPVFERLAEEYAERARFAKVNVDASAALARRFNVRAIPTVLVLRRGTIVSSTAGAQTAARLRQLVDAAL